MKRILSALLLVMLIAATASAAGRAPLFTFKPEDGGSLKGGFAVSGNALIFGTETGGFYALNKKNGALIWSYKGTNSITGVPAVVGENVFFSQADGTLTCLRVSDGSKVWETVPREGENSMIDSGLTAGNGMLLFARSDYKLYAVSQRDGRTLWTYSGSSQGLRTAPAYSDGLVFLGEYDGIFSIIDAKTGKRLNGGGAGGAINTPVVNNGNVYFSSWDGSVQAVKIKDVEPLWNAKIGDPVTTSPVTDGKIIVVGTGRGIAAALNADNGNVIWNFSTEGGEISANPVISGGIVYVASGDGQVFAVDAATGRTRYTYKAEFGGISEGMLVSDGVLYFGNTTIYAYN
ncbi:MAG: PQQ-binding-like beta-propeller repeat protein [Synergistaceae bacterium]|nr:PQQ-binding-like beta-propeller repeat protein [Synergistaceae bacterium]